MIINQKSFLKNDKNPETEANPVPKNWNKSKPRKHKHTEIKILDTHKHNNTITHTQTQQHGKDDLHRDNWGPEGGGELREAEREPQQTTE